jgi:hypothetical protein
MSALGPNDVWAVGYWYNSSPAKTLIEHWDGTQWSVIDSPNPGLTRNELYGVFAIAPNDVWAVGHHFVVIGSDNVYQTLVLHWDGTAWAHVPTPNLGTWNNYLRAVTAVSANDVWAVGSYVPSLSSPEQTLMLHWDGATWSAMPGPSPGSSYNILYSVDALASNDVWAVGYYNTANGADTLTLHWTGATWNLVPSANGTGRFSRLNAVDAIAPNDIWAVGYNNPDPGGAGNVVLTLVTHWDGSQWTQISSPSPATSSNYLNGVAAVSANDVWAVGYQKSGTGPIQTLTQHWDGSAWSTVASPNTVTSVNWLTGVDAVSANEVWAVGYAGNANTLALRYLNAPCSTPTPAPPTIPPTATATPIPTCPPAWHVQSSPNIGIAHRLLGVTALSANDVWAVGFYNDPNGFILRTLTMHYTNGEWSIVPSPNVGTSHNVLMGLTAVSANDVWAVGHYSNGGANQTLTMHYTNGEWSIIPSPNVGTSYNFLNGVAAVSANDVWAVGSYNNPTDNINRTLTMHYTGGGWSVVPSPNVGTGDNPLTGVTAVSANDLWAIGEHRESGYYQTLTMHYTNGQWDVVPSPNVGTNDHFLKGVTAVSANDVWIAGAYIAANGYYQTLTMHYTNGGWDIVPSPNLGMRDNRLDGITAVSANDLWAVGTWVREVAKGNSVVQTLTMHYTNGQWDVLPSPNVSTDNHFLEGVAAVSANDMWAVGNYDYDLGGRTLTLHYTNLCITPTPTALATTPPTATRTSTSTNTVVPPSATRTNTPGGPTATIAPSNTPALPSATHTNTPVPPTQTPGGATATVCSLEYIDVPTTNTFYPFIRCLACRGIISGYTDGTFRPGNNITRGQIAKMVSNSAGFSEDAGPQIYEDVPVGSPFYDWVNRLSMRGHMGGYPCGLVPEEPCEPPDDRPYFRPFASATRGQLSKIVSNAAGVAGEPSSLYYTDVPEDHPFYIWIMRLTNLGVMSGYPCGGENEPCDDQNRPYFRPFNDVTRGQASKISANTFYPGCQTPYRRQIP